MASYRSYCLTVRPRDGITETTVSQIKDWLRKCDYGVAVLEKENEARHLHAQIWLNKPRARGDICKQIQRICERSIDEWDRAQLKVLRQGVKIAYSDWYLDYLTENDMKTDEANIVYYSPPDYPTTFYPTEEEQDEIQSLKTAVDPRFCKLEQDYRKWLISKGVVNCSIHSVSMFLADSMFLSKTMKVILHQRDRKALATCLYAYAACDDNKYLFMDKDKDLAKTEKLLSNLNIQVCHTEDLEDEADAVEEENQKGHSSLLDNLLT